MRSLYVTSVERFSGKTAVCLGLGKRFAKDGYRVGYLKPLSLQAYRFGSHIVDEDAAFVKEILRLSAEPWELSPVVLSDEAFQAILQGESTADLMGQIKTACKIAGEGNDLLLLEGGGSLREGYAVDLPTPRVAYSLESDVLAVVKYRGKIRLVDDIIAARMRLGEALLGVIINRVPADAAKYVDQVVLPYLSRQEIRVLGVLPEVPILAAITVAELIEVLNAKVLTTFVAPDALVENLTIGAMTAEVALKRFRRQHQKAVITGGDRTDIQLAALETSTTCLILTGQLQPSPLIIRQANELGVTVLLVHENTMETVEIIDGVFGKTRLGQPVKLEKFQELLDAHVDFKSLYKGLGLV